MDDDGEATTPIKRVREEVETLDDTTLNPSKRLREENGQQVPSSEGPTSQLDAHTTPAKAKQVSRGRKGDGKSDTWASGRKGKRNRRYQDSEAPTATESMMELGERAESVATVSQDIGTKKERFPKKKCAVLIGFCGAGYNGMQMWVHQNARQHCPNR